MKELSIEEKAKAYDKAFERVKKLLSRCTDNRDRRTKVYRVEDIESIFPELKESEDEQSRKWILEYLYDGLRKSDEQFKGHFKTAIAWLEKQGQTFTKKDVDDAYLEGVTNTKNEIEKEYEATYQIRKDIATFILNYKGDIKDRAKWMNYLGIKVSFVEKQGEHASFIEAIQVGDKVTRNKDGILVNLSQLKRVAKKQGEQKPAEWSEEDEAVLDALIRRLEGEDIHVSPHLAVKCLKSLKGRVLPQRKQEWSEEDEQITLSIEQVMNCASLLNVVPEKIDKIKTWLKSLKQRIGG